AASGLDVGIAQADGSGNRNVLGRDAHGSFDAGPTWSPDGDLLAVAERFGGDACGRSSPTSPSCPGPSSALKVFVPGTGARTIASRPASTSTPIKLLSGAAWSPDGGRLAFTDGAGLWTVGRDGSRAHDLVAIEGADFTPAWSPDGGHLVFHVSLQQSQQPRSSLYVVGTDGHGLRALPPTDRGHDPHASWSPDSGTIAFAASPPLPGLRAIYTVHADGSSLRRVSDAFSSSLPEFAPRLRVSAAPGPAATTPAPTAGT